MLPNGPEMASSFLAVASYMSAAPLNPNYKRNEYEFYLSDLKPALVIVEQGSDNPVRQAAAALNIPVAEARVKPDMSAGEFLLFDEEADITPASTEQEALSCTPPALPRGRKWFPCYRKIFWPQRGISRQVWNYEIMIIV